MRKILLLTFLSLTTITAEKAITDLSLLETNRLTLRFSTTQDRQTFKEIATDNTVCKHLFGKTVNQEQMIKRFNTLAVRIGLYLNFLMKNRTIPFLGKSNRWVILDKEHNSEPIGFIGLKDADRNVRHLLLSDNYKNFSIFLKPDAQNKGYVKEITHTLIPAIMSSAEYQDVEGLCFLVSSDNEKVMHCLLQEDGKTKYGLSDLGTIPLAKATYMVPEPVITRMFTISRKNVMQQLS